ncbi:hypothetical protein [Mycoplasma sp. 1018B]|uniref:hypothetical protein n=1 Tax=Mycoplasma sp. 1018B TaxID=2967302 RepID=UPI00211D0E2B|nr:hypothetical protein [Mycoplasma sp. 1018B]UUM19359.1 hypothetical protein NPA14_00575 [Mycoplasma sp. 1018B]
MRKELNKLLEKKKFNFEINGYQIDEVEIFIDELIKFSLDLIKENESLSVKFKKIINEKDQQILSLEKEKINLNLELEKNNAR